MPNVNIPETKTIALVRSCQEKRRRQLIKKNDGRGRTGEEKKRRPRLRWTDNNREDMTKYELTADMTENRQYSSICHGRTPSGPGKSVRTLQLAAHQRGKDGHVEMSRDIDNVAIHSRWPLTTGVAQGRYYCTGR